LLGWLFFHESFDKITLLGVLLTLIAGVVTSFGEGLGEIVPALLVAGACLCWAIDNQQTSSLDAITPQAATCIKGLMAGSVNFIIGFSRAETKPSVMIIGCALAIGVFAYAQAFPFM